jgi:hypothetical protein
MATTAYQIGTMGNGALHHLIDAGGPVCDRPTDSSARWIDPQIEAGATEATCRKCVRVAGRSS